MKQISLEIKQSAGVKLNEKQQTESRLTEEEFQLVQLVLDLFACKTETPQIDERTIV